MIMLEDPLDRRSFRILEFSTASIMLQASTMTIFVSPGQMSVMSRKNSEQSVFAGYKPARGFNARFEKSAGGVDRS